MSEDLSLSPPRAVDHLRRIPRAARIAVLVVLLIVAIGAYVTTPHILASIAAEDAANPLRTSFAITNRGFFPAHEVKLQCVAHEVEFNPPIQSPAGKLPVTTVSRDELRPNDSASVTCARGLDQAGQVVWADLDVNVCLKPYPVIDYVALMHYRFVGERSASGNFQWRQEGPKQHSIGWVMMRRESDVQECVWAQ